MIGVEPMQVPTLRAAANYGLCPECAEEISVQGEVFTVEDFKRVQQNKNLQFSSIFPGRAGKIFAAIAEKALRANPKLKKDECVGCNLCGKLCLAKAITIVKNKAKIDKKKCIRCFCCQEFCPVGAMVSRPPLLNRLLLGKK